MAAAAGAEHAWRVRDVPVAAGPDAFAASCEDPNLPAVFRGLVSGWPAVRLWGPPADGGSFRRLRDKLAKGLPGVCWHAAAGYPHRCMGVTSGSRTGSARLQQHSAGSPRRPALEACTSHMLAALAGKATVQAMASVGPIFYGNLGSHERVAATLGDLLQLAPLASSQCHPSEGEQSAPMYDAEDRNGVSLAPLLEDIQKPDILKKKEIASINFWMSIHASISSIHYDPYHNLLCVVSGRKTVSIWPPSAAGSFSAINLLQPDYKQHPQAANYRTLCKTVTLASGDALFLPEGWYHQVNSERSTIAVNFWWPSKVCLAFGSHMDTYYARRILISLLDYEKKRTLEAIAPFPSGEACHQAQDKEPQDSSTSSLQAANVSASQGQPRSPGDLEDGAFQPPSLMNAEGDESGSGTSRKVDVPAERRHHKMSSKGGRHPKRRTTAVNGESVPSSIKQGVSLDKKDEQQVEKRLGRKRSATVQSLTGKEQILLRALVMGTAGLSGISQEFKGDPSSNSGIQMDHRLGAGVEKSRGTVSDAVPADQTAAGGNTMIDTVARVFAALDPRELRRVLLAMVDAFPITLHNLILQGLKPSAAEYLTTKLEEGDSRVAHEQSGESMPGTEGCAAVFYERLYSVFDDKEAVMAALLLAKEAFAKSVLQQVFDKYLGLIVTFPEA
eukprot:SM000007S20816  [mRNA]  locus=s7:318142:322356:- [translate_table: standard]